MTKNFTSLRKSSPLLFILGFGQLLGHENLGWLWGGFFWLMTSRLYLVPRRMQRFSAETLPGLIGELYGKLARTIVGGIHATYFSILLIKALQRWYRFPYMEASWQTCAWMVLGCWGLLIISSVLGSRSFARVALGTLLLVVSMSLPLLVHLFHPSLQDLFATPLTDLSWVRSRYFTGVDFNIFVIASCLGHPLLSGELLEISGKRRIIRLFKLAGITLLCLSITNSIVLSNTVDPTGRWAWVLAAYRAATYALSAGVLLFMVVMHVSEDMIKPLLSSYSGDKKDYFLAGLLGTLMVVSAYVAPENVIKELAALSLVLVAISQWALLLMLIGLYPSNVNFYASLVAGPLLYGAIKLLGWSWLAPYALGVSVLVSALSSLAWHYISQKGFCMQKRNWWEEQDVEEFALRASHIKKACLSVLWFPFRMALYAQKGLARQRIPYRSLHLYFCLISFLGLRLWPIEAGSTHAHTAYGIFVFNLICCVIACLQPVWPRALAPYFALYWHFSLASHLVVTPLVLYFAAGYHATALVNLVLSLILLARFVSPLGSFVVQILGILGSCLIVPYLMPDAWEALLREPQQLYTLGYSLLVSYFVGALFVRKNRREMEETRDKLKSLVKKSIAIVSNALNITKSHAKIIELCMHTMEVQEKADGKVHINMKQDSYDTMEESLTKLLCHMDTGRSQLKRVFVPINSTIKTREFAEYQVSPCVREAIDTFVNDYEARKEPRLHVEEDFMFVGSDQTLISVLIQLLKNGHECSDTQGDISIRIKDHKIYITNSGSEIAKEDLPHIFNEFFTSNPDNLGLGLFFAKEVMECFGGEIYLAPTQEEGSTCLVLAFPQR